MSLIYYNCSHSVRLKTLSSTSQYFEYFVHLFIYQRGLSFHSSWPAFVLLSLRKRVTMKSRFYYHVYFEGKFQNHKILFSKQQQLIYDFRSKNRKRNIPVPKKNWPSVFLPPRGSDVISWLASVDQQSDRHPERNTFPVSRTGVSVICGFIKRSENCVPV